LRHAGGTQCRWLCHLRSTRRTGNTGLRTHLRNTGGTRHARLLKRRLARSTWLSWLFA